MISSEMLRLYTSTFGFGGDFTACTCSKDAIH